MRSIHYDRGAFRMSMSPSSWIAVAAALIGAIWTSPLAAQRTSLDSVRMNDTTVVHALTLIDGSRIIGRITSVTADSVRIASAVASVTVARRTVRQVSQYPAKALRNGELWADNPHATRLIFGPTAIPLRKGEGYFSDFWIFLISSAVGVTDRFTIGGGMSLIPGIDINENIFFILPKLTVVSRPTFTLAVGGLAAHVGIGSSDDLSVNDNRSLGVLYGVATTGSRESNLSLGVGWGYVGGALSERPVVTLGGQHRVSRRIALISENWFLPFDDSNGSVVSYGLRFIGEKIAVDLAFATLLKEAFFPGVPLLGFTIKY